LKQKGLRPASLSRSVTLWTRHSSNIKGLAVRILESGRYGVYLQSYSRDFFSVL